jgi:hypothetical protein
VKLRAFLVGDAVSTGDGGKVFVHGGGIRLIRPTHYPWSHAQLGFLLTIEADDEVPGSDHEVTIRVLDPDGARLADLTSGFRLGPAEHGLPPEFSFAATVQGLVLPVPGRYELVALVDEDEIARFPLVAVEPKAPNGGGESSGSDGSTAA